MSEIYPEVDKASREAGLLKGKTKLPKLGTALDAREKDMEIAAGKRGRRRKDKRTIYINEKYANNWRKIPLHAMVNKLAKNTNCPTDLECAMADTRI